MATATKICKVCGAEYPYCKTEFKPGVFRYQDVACCPEHGSIYLAKVLEARTGVPQPNEEQPVKKANDTSDNLEELINLILSEDEDDEDEDFFFEEDEDEE